MNKQLLLFLGFLLCFGGILKGQTASDSITIVSTQWKTVSVQKGIVHKSAIISQLYGGSQSINIVEMDAKAARLGIAVAEKGDVVSTVSPRLSAIAAINGSFFDMKKGNSTCFLKVNESVIDTTRTSEWKLRVTGAVYERKGKMKILPWSRPIEKEYKGKKGTVLASGPLMLKDGKMCDWSKCNKDFIDTKHPRSAVCIGKDGKIWFVTVDGRFPERAVGVSIPELAHLIRVLGGKEALNLDGGGSTTLWVNNASENGVVNYPCDNSRFDHQGERRVANLLYMY